MRDCVRRFAEAVDKKAPKDHTVLTEDELFDIIEHQLYSTPKGDDAFRSALVEIGVAAMAAWDNSILERKNG